MFDLPTGHYIQLLIALSGGILLYAFAYVLPASLLIRMLILVIPFQVIQSRYGSVNMVLTYLLGIVLLFKSKLRFSFFLVPFGGIVCACLLSIMAAPPDTYTDHILYMISLGSNFVLFYIIYSFVKEGRTPLSVLHMLVILNILVNCYCLAQLLVGFEQVNFLGIKELTLVPNREDQRLTGPFALVGVTAEYFVIQIWILGYMLIHETNTWKKILYWGLIMANFGFLVATGNRGGFLALLLGTFLFYFFYYKELGLLKIGVSVIVGVPLLFFVSFLVITYTPFNVLYSRLTATSFEGGIPDTRGGAWAFAWEGIKQKPVLGHGPRFWLFKYRQLPTYRQEAIIYPHSLYLFILYTVGTVGLVAYMVLFAAFLIQLYRANRIPVYDPVLRGLPRLGLLVICMFLFDQIKISFLRYGSTNYQHYVFLLWAFFMGAVELIREEQQHNPTIE